MVSTLNYHAFSKKILALPKGENEVEKMFKEESIGISGCNYFKNVVVEKISQ